MKILYISVHSVLEDDEIRMFKHLGHDVFPLGVNFGFHAIEPFRESIVFNEREHALMECFHALGCSFRYGAPFLSEIVITPEFVALFDVVIVMHELSIIERLWPALSLRPVVWRTIGQGIEDAELIAAPLHANGMHIVRYSPLERLSPHYCGETAMIRFGKNQADYGPWVGHALHVLTFSNVFAQRYPAEAAIYREIVDGLPAMLGGVGNEEMPSAVGLLTPEQQKTHYDHCRAYLYCSGAHVPYTLNFMEALMTGMPVVAVAFDASPYYEVPALLGDGAGFAVATVDDARYVLHRLLTDADFAMQTSRSARARAIELFSFDHISAQWDDLLESIVR